MQGASNALFVKFAYDLGRERKTGEIVASSRGVRLDTIIILGGAAITPELDALGRQLDERLRRIVTHPGTSYAFSPGRVAASGRRVALGAWARRAIERQLDADGARSLASELRDRKLSLRRDAIPDRDALDALDVALLGLLAMPRTVTELSSLTRLPSFRVLAFLHFLRSIGALVMPFAVEEPAPASTPLPRSLRRAAFEHLGVPEGASGDLVKRTFKRLARALHPDLHPDACESERRVLERRLAALNAAYGELMFEAS